MVTRKSPRTAIGRQAASVRRGIADDLSRAIGDAGLSHRAVAIKAGIDPGYLSRVLAGGREPSLSVLTAVADVLGGRVSCRFVPGTGPRIHDRFQAPIGEALLRLAHPRWHPGLEVSVYRPVRGVVDLVFATDRPPTLVVTEIQSRIDRLEQQLRWFQAKTDAIRSSDLAAGFESEPVVHRLLVLRSTVATRELANAFAATLAAAYPARASDAVAALASGDLTWPGSAIIWADLRSGVARVMSGPPRGVALGR
jgi:transcriptional regulator with XRE-family HTH domain